MKTNPKRPDLWTAPDALYPRACHSARHTTEMYEGIAPATRSRAARVLEARLLSSTSMPRRMTVDDLIASFMNNARHRTLASSTRRRYRRALRLLSSALGTKPIAAVGIEYVVALYASASKIDQKPAAGPSRARVMEALEFARRLWNFGRSRGFCETNPFYMIRFPRPARCVRLWTVEQLSMLIAAADAANRPEIGAVAALCYWLSLPICDVLALRPEDLHGTSLIVPGKRNRRIAKRIELNRYLLDRFDVMFGASGGHAPDENPRITPDAFRRAFARIRRQAGLPDGLTARSLRLSRPLELRHTGAIAPWFVHCR